MHLGFLQIHAGNWRNCENTAAWKFKKIYFTQLCYTLSILSWYVANHKMPFFTLHFCIPRSLRGLSKFNSVVWYICMVYMSKWFWNLKKHVRRPRFEPGSWDWETQMLTTTPTAQPYLREHILSFYIDSNCIFW
jgi:hypothetical protein